MIEVDIKERFMIEKIKEYLFEFKSESDFNKEFDFTEGKKLGKG